MLLNGNPADDEVWYLVGGESGDGGLGSLHDAGRSGILTQNICRLIGHLIEGRTSHWTVQFVSGSQPHPRLPAPAAQGYGLWLCSRADTFSASRMTRRRFKPATFLTSSSV